MRTLAALALLPLAACDDQKIALGGGAPPDARLYADVYTWECEDPNTGDLYEGVFSYQVSFEYAPDALADRDLPSSGCSRGLDLFPSDAGSGATDIPDAGTPSWTTGDLSGALDHAATGFYFDNAFDNRASCTDAEELLAGGTAISDAGVFSGAAAPTPGSIADVTLEGEVDEQTGIPFGAQVTATWDASGWDATWIQVRREKSGSLVESVTCAASGDSYTLDEDAWSLLNDALQADVTNLYVAFQVEGGSATDDGQEIVTQTRAMHVAVVQD